MDIATLYLSTLPCEECPMCLDISYEDSRGEVHILYDLCNIHANLEPVL